MHKYKVLSHWTREGLEQRVSSYLNAGYTLVGSVSVSMTDTYGDLETEYVQAVVKVEQ